MPVIWPGGGEVGLASIFHRPFERGLGGVVAGVVGADYGM